MQHGSRLRIGIVGLGTVGRLHLRALEVLDDAQVVGVSNLRLGAGLDPADVAGMRIYETADDLINDPEVQIVAICSESGSHARHVQAAIRAGKHVVVEKPLAVDPMAAADIVTAAAKTDLTVSVISQRRFEPHHQYLKKLIEDGRLGTPILVEGFTHWYRDDAYYASSAWRRSMSHGGGSLMNQGVHIVDLMLWFFGEVTEIRGDFATIGHEFDAEDTAVATMRFRSGALGVLVTSTAVPRPSPARIDLFMSNGSISLEDSSVARWDVPGIPPPPTTLDIPSGLNDPTAIGAIGLRAQWTDILTAIRAGRAPAVTCESGFTTARVCAAIYEAGATGRTIRLEQQQRLNSWLTM